MIFKITDFSFLEKQVEAIVAYLKKAHEQFLQRTVIYEAQNYASKNQPGSKDESFESHLTTSRGFYNTLIKEVSVRLQGGVQRTLGAVNVATINQHIETKESEIKHETDKRDRLVVDRGRIFLDGVHKSYNKQKLLMIIIAVFECLWMISAFLKLGDIVLIAICLGAGVGIAQMSSVTNATQIIKEVEDLSKQRRYIIGTTACFLIESTFLALLRYWFIHVDSVVSVPFFVMNPMTFVIINMLFITATALIVYFHYPTKSQIKEMDKAVTLDKEIQKSKYRDSMLVGELKILKKEREFLVELRTRLIHAEEKLHEKINMMFDEAVGVFKHENTLKRPDNAHPLCFKNPHKPLLENIIEKSNLLNN